MVLRGYITLRSDVGASAVEIFHDAKSSKHCSGGYIPSKIVEHWNKTAQSLTGLGFAVFHNFFYFGTNWNNLTYLWNKLSSKIS